MIDLKEERQAAGMTQQELADALECHRTTVTNIELGNTKPSVEMAQKIGKILNLDWPKFFSEE